MFKVEPNPTFKASLILVGQGREQTLNVTYKHKTTDEFSALMESVAKGDKTSADAVLELVESWDADAELNADTIAKLQKSQPGVDWAIVEGYSRTVVVERKKN
jgi:hypothetical protein